MPRWSSYLYLEQISKVANARTGPVIAIAAGGTGGHIFPAVATGEKLRELVPGMSVHYACGERPLELSLFERSSIEPTVFPARQLKPGPIAKLAGMAAAGGNLLRAARWLKATKADVVIGFGGYVSGPTVLAGKLVGCKTAIHEANSIPGKTNKILSSFMDLTSTHFEATLSHLAGKKKLAVGMPLRPLSAASSKAEARTALGLEPGMETLLIMGGSQGAKFLYENIMNALPQLDRELDRPLQVLWSTGDQNLEDLQVKARGLALERITLHLVPFVNDMGNALLAADVALARAGASTLAELISFGVYTVYVPFPGAIYDHQTHNAMEAKRYGLGTVLKEADVPNMLLQQLHDAFGKIRAGYSIEPPESLQSSGAAERLAREVMALIKRPL